MPTPTSIANIASPCTIAAHAKKQIKGKYLGTSNEIKKIIAPCRAYKNDAERAKYPTIGPSGRSPSPSRRCKLEIVSRGAITARNAVISRIPRPRSVNSAAQKAFELLSGGV